VILNSVRLQQRSLPDQIRDNFRGALEAIGIRIASSSSDFIGPDEDLLLLSPERRLFMDANELLPDPAAFEPENTPFRPARIEHLYSPPDMWTDPRVAALDPPPGTAQRLEPRLTEDQAVDANRINDSAKKAREALQITP
jgi:hypothetical protein